MHGMCPINTSLLIFSDERPVRTTILLTKIQLHKHRYTQTPFVTAGVAKKTRISKEPYAWLVSETGQELR